MALQRKVAGIPVAPVMQPSTMLVETVPMESIRVHPRNPVIHDEANIRTIMTSLQTYGQAKTIAVWNGFIVAGNGTFTAARRLGWRTISITRVDHLTESQALAYLLMDNKASDGHTYDEGLTADLVRGIAARGDISLEATGFTTFELEPMLSGDLPSLPPGMDDFDAGEGMQKSGISGNSAEMQRVIIIYETEEEKREIYSALGIDPNGMRVSHSYRDCTNLTPSAPF